MSSPGYFGRPIEKLGPNHIRTYQVHLFRDRKRASRTVRQHVAALRFVFVKTPKCAYMLDYIPFPKEAQGLPIVLSQEEVTRLIEASGLLMHRAMLMTLYATGMRRTEAANLKGTDVDSNRIVIHVHEGKGRRDRDIPLSSKSIRKYKVPFPMASPPAPPRTRLSPRFRTPPQPRAGRLAGRPAGRRPGGGDTSPAWGWGTGRSATIGCCRPPQRAGRGATWGRWALPLTPAP